ncbi:amidohydrolase family protein [Herbiconiux sp. VKM Ac-1786]|uniref:amidohydrolase n=1 Tax=Herbiconiux sp. VKM Ac-1786 TaxID=2783824 RepID=UPI00188D8519|nr:amidohydrolase family protein [Herbiconiux sp. VKM Ac-1786]MBF4570991.1 amidohydrolase family protein [Herbiconiux sp. VKM Ac-1786]
MTGDLLLAGGRLPGSTSEGRFSDGGAAVDIVIADGEIAVITPAGDGTPKGFERIELDGRWVVPGLWDNHVHFTSWAAVAQRLDVASARSAAEAATLVGEAERSEAARGAASVGDSAEAAYPLVGIGFRDALWPDEPSAALLDAVSGSRPVVLISADLHCCWLNTAALRRFGFDGDAAGSPRGVLREEPAFAVQRALGELPDALTDAWALDAASAAAARGVVGVVDLEMTWNAGTWARRVADGNDLLRVEFGVYPQHLERAIAEGLRTGEPLAGTQGLVQVGPFKVITDGSLNTRTAFCFDEYPGLEGRPDAHGQLTVPPEELSALLHRAREAGLVPAVHAIGDHANRLALDAFEALGGGGSLEHAQLLDEADIARFAGLGVIASVQPEHAMDDRDVAERYWAGRTGRAFALESLRAAGATLALGSDAPVAPLDPWVTMAAAVGRTRDGREPWHPEQRIPASAALLASTRGRASVRTGQAADLTVVEHDPLTAAPDALRTMPVALTLLAGRETHRAL